MKLLKELTHYLVLSAVHIEHWTTLSLAMQVNEKRNSYYTTQMLKLEVRTVISYMLQ